MRQKQLVRSRQERVFLGVAGGISDYLETDPVFVRLVFIAIALVSFGHAALLYLILALLMPAPGSLEEAPLDESEIVIKGNQ